MSWSSRARGTLIDTYLGLVQRAPGARRAEFYFQSDDPYSYLLAQLTPGLTAVHGASVRTEVVVSLDAASNPEPELRLRHAMRDCAELARYYDLHFPVEPVAPDREMTLRAAAEVARGADPAVVGRLVWTGDHGALPPVLAGDRRSLGEGARRLKRRGHYMGGMLRVGPRWCWGIDRLHYAEAALGGVPQLLKRRPRRRRRASRP